MAFENLLDIPMPENELLEKLIEQVIFTPFDEQKMYYLKLQIPNGLKDVSQIAWIKVFSDFNDLYEYQWQSEYQQSSIQLAAHDGEIQILCEGFFLSDWVHIENGAVKSRCPYFFTEANREEQKKLPRELVEKAFGELEVHLLTSPRAKKAV
jgi:hypothetical protein